MKRFVFRAQAALDLRLKQEDDAKRAVAIAQSQLLEVREALVTARRVLDDMLQRWRDEEAAGNVIVGEWYRNWTVGQRQRIEGCDRSVTRREQELDQAKAIALEARRKAKALERFRERAWQRHEREAAREEQRQLDEHGAVRFALESGRGGVET